MSFAEVNVLGVFIAPMSVMLLAAWIITITFRRFAARFGLLSYVWHPALFIFSIYLIVLSCITAVVASTGVLS